MTTLSDLLLVDSRREALTADCAAAVEHHLNGLRSLRGMALKAGLAMFKTAVPDAIPRVVRRLLPDFAIALEPLHQQFRQARAQRQSEGVEFSAFLQQHREAAVDALIATIDRRAAASRNEPVKAAYGKLRGGVRGELAAAWPQLAAVIGRHLG